MLDLTPRPLEHVARAPFTDPSEGAVKTAAFLAAAERGEALWWIMDAEGDPVGYLGLFDIDRDARKAELGYGLLADHWGRGYATEAVTAVVEAAEETLGLHRVYGLVTPGNVASARILEHLEFACEGRLRHDAYARGRWFDFDIFARVFDGA